MPHAYARTQRRRSRIVRRRPADRPNRLPPHARACTSSRAMLTHIPFPALPVPPSWFPGHMLQFQRMLPTLLNKTDVVLELRDARLPLTSINRNFEGKSAALFSSFLLIDRAHCGTTRCHVHGFFEAEWHCNVARRLDAECRCCAVGAFSPRTFGESSLRLP